MAEAHYVTNFIIISLIEKETEPRLEPKFGLVVNKGITSARSTLKS
jgi:hypothetical protein